MVHLLQVVLQVLQVQMVYQAEVAQVLLVPHLVHLDHLAYPVGAVHQPLQVHLLPQVQVVLQLPQDLQELQV